MRTLHTRLVLTLLALIVPVSVLFVVAVLQTSQRYYQEITQQQNAGLAAAILSDTPNLMVDQNVDTAVFDEVASSLAMTNPGVEIYILENNGHIIGSSVEMIELQRKFVALEPVQLFLGRSANYPIMGTDPRRGEGGKIFSVTPLADEDGYVYVLLADRVGDSIIRTVQNSTVLRLGLWGGVTMIALVAGVAALAFSLLTRRLRRLERAVTDFREQDFVLDGPLLGRVAKPRDEIDTLQNIFSDMAQRISEQLQGLRQVDRLRRELVTNVSHDLRTPLAALQGYLETLQLKGGLNPEAAGYLSAARRHGKRLERLVSDLFDLSRLEAGAVEASLEPFPLAELAQDVVLGFQDRAKAQGIELRLQVGEGLPFVRLDLGLMERALSNLIDNALRYTPAGGKVRLALEPARGGVRLKISDTGQGIAESDLPHIFERFYRASKHEGPEGSGLGLAITRRIVQLHGSNIQVSSKVGQGTRFSFVLRAA